MEAKRAEGHAFVALASTHESICAHTLRVLTNGREVCGLPESAAVHRGGDEPECLSCREVVDDLERHNLEVHGTVHQQGGGEADAWMVTWDRADREFFRTEDAARNLAVELTENGWLNVAVIPLFAHPLPEEPKG